MPVFCFPWSPVACKVFLKKCLLLKWPHWGCSICTGWKLPNSVLHIEEKSRGQKFLSTEIWRKLRCLQNSIHNQTASGSAYFRGAGEKQNKKKKLRGTGNRGFFVMCKQQANQWSNGYSCCIFHMCAIPHVETVLHNWFVRPIMVWHDNTTD